MDRKKSVTRDHCSASLGKPRDADPHHTPVKDTYFLTYDTEFVLVLAMLGNSVLPMGWDSLHATLKVTSEL